MSPMSEMKEMAGDFHRCLFENLDDAVCFVNVDGIVTHWNPAAADLTGFPAEDVLATPCESPFLAHIDSENTSQEAFSPLRKALIDGEPRKGRYYLRHRQGHLIPVHVKVIPLYGEGEPCGAIEVFMDDSARQVAENRKEELRSKSLLDPVTGLASRRHLEVRLQHRMDETCRYGWRFGVVFAAIDNFKAVSQAHKIESVDQLVQMVGKTFANTLRTYDVVGRWNVDEFMAIVPIRSDDDLGVVAERVRSLVERSCVSVEGRVLGATISVGATSLEQEDSIESVVQRGHAFMSESLKRGNTITRKSSS